ncbi:AlpA family phage regulatory protein [Aquibium sp. LZ166]|uniref:AlpA family phage regulatory protein n=1 Tax=Aquibium pacificus TaxID=3153579 RepID=A0ABV3SPY8_9HYPH
MSNALFNSLESIPQRRATDAVRNGRITSAGHATVHSGQRFIGKKELRNLVSISPQHIDRLEKAGQFPTRIRLGPGRVAWLLSEVTAWMEAKIMESRRQ